MTLVRGAPRGEFRYSERITTTAESIDEYLARLRTEQAQSLRESRHTRGGARSEECISYGVPSFRLGGKHLVSFGAGAKHCAFYPGAIVAAYADELRAYGVSRGTVRFAPNRPIPAELVTKLVQARIARISVKAAAPAQSRCARAAKPLDDQTDPA